MLRPASLVLFGVFLGQGCAGRSIRDPSFQKGLVESRARFDLDCHELDVVALGNNTFGAHGCGKRTTYIVVCTGGVGQTDLCNAVANAPETHKD